MELKYLTIAGKQYPACFSLRTAMRVAEKYGSLDAMYEGRPLPEAVEVNIWLLDQCLQAGQQYAALEGTTCDAPPAADTLLDLMGIRDAGAAVAAILEASQQVTVELQPLKNPKATQDS